MNVADVRADLLAEQQALDSVVSDLDPQAWSTPTASDRWSVADQIGHLAYFDRTAALAMSDPEGFKNHVAELVPQLTGSPEAMDLATLSLSRTLTGPELLGEWRAARDELASASRSLGNDERVIWYGPSMSSKSFLTARLMECWAHGQDVVDAVGADRPSTDRLIHIAQLGFITRGWTYKNRGLDVPQAEVRVELTSPSGAEWFFGPAGAPEYVRGSATEFCLVVTQRRNVHATGLEASPIALDWLERAQAFAGAATDPPSVSG